MDVNELADKADEATLANNEGAALHDQDRYEEAIPYFEKVLSQDPKNPDALDFLDYIKENSLSLYSNETQKNFQSYNSPRR